MSLEASGISRLEEKSPITNFLEITCQPSFLFDWIFAPFSGHFSITKAKDKGGGNSFPCLFILRIVKYDDLFRWHSINSFLFVIVKFENLFRLEMDSFQRLPLQFVDFTEKRKTLFVFIPGLASVKLISSKC